ncbi:MAG: flagellar basal body rod protein FlgC [Phycisphaerae bacterium]|nr:flagellar basal body rod protein FlgC [Phycisphaerae bacterium]
MFGSLEISTSALIAQRVRMDVISGNLANTHTTRRLDGQPGPFRRHMVAFATGNPGATAARDSGGMGPGVHVAAVEEDPSPGRFVLDPSHPDAIKSGPMAGHVEYPNIDIASEMVDAIEASRAYEANITAIDVTKSMISTSLRLLA